MEIYNTFIKNIKFEKCKQPIKESSINIYMRNIKKLFKELNSKPDIKLFNDHEKVVDYIDSLKTIASKKTMCTSIVVLLKCNNFPVKKIKVYSSKLSEIAYKQNNVYIKNTKSKREDTNWITIREIQDTLQKLQKETENLDTNKSTIRQKFDIYQKFIITRLYTSIPPVRNDYANTKVFDIDETNVNEKEYNYINLKEKILLLQHYKTAKFYGIKKIKLPDDLVIDLKNFEKYKKNLCNTEFLLLNTTDFKPLSGVNLTKTLNKIFYPKKVSSTILRKVYLSYKYPISHSMEEMQKDADIMGHDITTARKIYTKITE